MAVNLQIVQLYRPLNMSNWFMFDPVAHTIEEESFVCGVRCELAEAIVTDEGLIVWRISGIPQKAESAIMLENGRRNDNQVVHVGTIKVNPVTLQCMPKRIVTRCFVKVQPMLVLRLQRCHINSDGDNRVRNRARPKSRSIEPEDTPDALDEPPTSPEIDTVAVEDEPPSASANGHLSSGSKSSSERAPSPDAPASPDPSASPEAQRPESPDAPDLGWGPPEEVVLPVYEETALCDPRLGSDSEVKTEPNASPRDDFDDDVGDSVSVKADGPLDNVHIKQEPIDDGYTDDSSVVSSGISTAASQGGAGRGRPRGRGRGRPRGTARKQSSVLPLKRPSREQILASEKRLKQSNEDLPTAGPSKISLRARRPIDSECVDLQGKASIYVEASDSDTDLDEW